MKVKVGSSSGGCGCGFYPWIRMWSLQTWSASLEVTNQPRRPGGRSSKSWQALCERRRADRSARYKKRGERGSRHCTPATKTCRRGSRHSVHPNRNHCTCVDTEGERSVPGVRKVCILRLRVGCYPGSVSLPMTLKMHIGAGAPGMRPVGCNLSCAWPVRLDRRGKGGCRTDRATS